MFGVSDDLVFDAAAIEEEQRRCTVDTVRIRRVLFWGCIVFAPAPYWFLVAAAFAPVSYFAALGLVHPESIPLTAIPVLICSLVLYALARATAAALISCLDSSAARYVACAVLLALLVLYAAFPGYAPLHGYDAIRINFADLIHHAFGPLPAGVC
jgi:hypothetical protein